MIVRRGNNKGLGESLWDCEVGFSTGFTPKGKVRAPMAILSYSTFKRLFGYSLEPGEWTEVKLVKIPKSAVTQKLRPLDKSVPWVR